MISIESDEYHYRGWAMKFAVVSSISFLLLSGAASAADVAPLPVYDWSGIYGGVHAGYMNSDISIYDAGFLDASGSITGFVGGPLAGVNVQADQFVFGLEGDYGWSNGTGHGTKINDYSYTYDWNTHARARAGIAFDNILLFGAGGITWANFHATNNNISMGNTYMGYNFGGGVDVGFTPNWIGRVEYIRDIINDAHIDQNDDDYSSDLTSNTVRAALIYKFGY
jgi:outer membrane immunogenic protein